MREIIFDTETTGFDPGKGDRVVEIGAVELLDGCPTGRTFHRYVNPERDMPEGAYAVHGLSAEFLADKPVFADPTVGPAFVEFIGDGALVAHNAQFDVKFISAELELAGFAPIANRVVDTLELARKKFPGAQNSLDALCKRFDISLDARDKHGALLDSQLLADVYIELTGGRQRALFGGASGGVSDADDVKPIAYAPRPSPLRPLLTSAEKEAHRAFIGEMGEDALWRRCGIPQDDAESPAAQIA
ncbi:MAG: DNA polymerase III subunit epsilon [Pseudomonadota bacterium]